MTKIIDGKNIIGSVVCDGCGKEHDLCYHDDKYNSIDNFDMTINFAGGYGSQYDGIFLNLNFCVGCSEGLVNLLRERYGRIDIILNKQENITEFNDV